MTGKLDEISLAIGDMGAKIDGLTRALQQSEKRAAVHRAGVHRRMDEVVGDLTEVREKVAVATTSIAAVQQEVTKIKGVTDDVEKMRQRAIGAGTLGLWLWRAGYALMGAAAGFAGAIAFLTGRPPP